MPLDNALRYALRNFSTLFLVAALVTVPLQLAYSFVYRDVVAVGELHEFIAELPQGRKVSNVGRGRLEESRDVWLGLALLELVLVPLGIRATARVVAVDAAGGLPGVLDAWGHALSPRRGPWPPWPWAGAGRLGAIAGGFLIAVAVGWLTQTIGLILAELFGVARPWLWAGLTHGVALAAGAPWALVVFVSSAYKPSSTERGWSSSPQDVP